MTEKLSLEALLESGMPKAADLKDVETIDLWLEHAAKWSGQVDKVLTMLDKFGLIDIAKKAAYKKYELDKVQDGSIMPKTHAHKILFNNLNNMNEEQLQQLFAKMEQDAQNK